MLSNTIVGDKVRSVIDGWGIISNSIEGFRGVNYPHKNFDVYYHINGKKFRDDLYPDIVEVGKKTE
jgi:hypothetical protein